MSMYAVNASVPKTLVRHLVRYYADTCENQKLAEILLDILDTPVSPELLPPKDGVISQKQKDLSDHMNCMISSCIICFAGHFHRKRSSVWLRMHLQENMMMKRS